WANIQHRKGAQDKKRGKLFTKLIREITVATRVGGPDLSSNPRLRLAIDKGKAQSLPKDRIEKAVKKGSGDVDGEDYFEVTYEGYGPGGVAVMVKCLTDNRNRTVSEIRHGFSKHGGNLGADGSVGYMFKMVGLISYPVGIDEDTVMEAALDAGAEDVVTNEDASIDVLTDPASFSTVNDALQAAGLESEMAEITMRADLSSSLEVADAQKMIKLLDTLEDLDDVQNVYSNADISDEVLAQLD
ncbi:MAG: YebC/PmpR family DNA-binding transcriptional regulator, partial [Gammaproteobacteria bacterium]|nr:YebC/PmpR family DNA-binding transcriptional regulator [Gammaproteobacteria bacterium]